MNTKAVASHICSWIKDYAKKAGKETLVVGLSGGIDSSVCSILCAMTGLRVLSLSLPISQKKEQLKCAELQSNFLKRHFKNVDTNTINLTGCFDKFAETLEGQSNQNTLARANSKARLRMMTLYHIAALENGLVVGTGNKIEDFGIGFFTKYGDGGVDISPIADLYKSEVYLLGEYLGVPIEIQQATPTDGLWEDGRTDYDQLQCSYQQLEIIMEHKNGKLFEQNIEPETLRLYENLHAKAIHKITPIPICHISDAVKNVGKNK